MSLKSNLSTNLKKYRESMNLSQEDLAAKVGVSRQAVSKWENPLSNDLPLLDKIECLTKLFQISYNDLLSENNTPLSTLQNIDVKSELMRVIKQVENMNNPDRVLSEYFEDCDLAFGRGCFNEGVEAIEAGQIDNALMHFEDALAHGHLNAFDALLRTYQKGCEFLEYEVMENPRTERELLKFQYSFSKRVQNYGKIAEIELEKKLGGVY